MSASDSSPPVLVAVLSVEEWATVVSCLRAARLTAASEVVELLSGQLVPQAQASLEADEILESRAAVSIFPPCSADNPLRIH